MQPFNPPLPNSSSVVEIIVCLNPPLTCAEIPARPIGRKPCFHIESRVVRSRNIERDSANVCRDKLGCLGACHMVVRESQICPGGDEFREVHDTILNLEL